MRTRISVMAVLALAFVTVACGDEEQASQTTPTTTVAPTTTTTSTSTTVVTTTTTTVDQFEPMLLDASDLGAAWKVGNELNEADFSDSVQVPCDDTGLNPTIAARLRGVTGRQFEPTDNSYKHLMEMIATGLPARLMADLDAYIGAIDSCPAEGTWNNAPVKIEKLTIPDLGDQRAAYAVSTADSAESQTTWYIRSGMVRVGNVIVSIGLTEILSSPDQQPVISDAEYVTMFQTAVAKVSG